MPSKWNKPVISLVLAASTAGIFQGARAADLMTLFTTPEERQIINANRYQRDDIKPFQQPVIIEEDDTEPVEQAVREEVTREYLISGITLSRDGTHTVWINSTAYEDGEQLEDRSKIKVLPGNEIRVRITAPDGNMYYATAGQTLEITYQSPSMN